MFAKAVEFPISKAVDFLSGSDSSHTINIPVSHSLHFSLFFHMEFVIPKLQKDTWLKT